MTKKDIDWVSLGKGLGVITAVLIAGFGSSSMSMASNEQEPCTVARFEKHSSLDSMKWVAQDKINITVDSLDQRTRRIEHMIIRIDERLSSRSR
jgi:hypothetical protein